MGFWRFARSYAFALALTLACAAVVAVMLAVVGSSEAFIVLVCALIVLAFALAVLLDYLRRRPFYDDLADLSERMESPRFAVEMLERPGYADGAVAYDALAAISKNANDEIGAYRRQVEDYREYIETWVHEAKSPLAAAHLMVENLAADADDESWERLDALAEELRRTERYIEQALFYARSETVEKDYLVRRHNLRSLVTSALRANSHALIGAHVAVFMQGLDRDVYADDKWVAFILGQIIQNSVKYARDEGAEITFEARLVGAGMSDEHVELAVRDNGCGVSAADLPRVFDKGFTGDNGRTARTGKRATGLGLYLVKRLCDKMGLGISASSREGEGFCVTIAFPLNRMHLLER